MRFIGTRVHGYLDYIVAILLIAAPWLFKFYEGGLESWIPIGFGILTIIYSMITKYELGAFPRINMSSHLTMDILSGFVLASSPWLFSFSDVVWLPHLLVGIFEIGVASATKVIPDNKPRSFASI